MSLCPPLIIKDEAWLCLSGHLQYSYTAGSGVGGGRCPGLPKNLWCCCGSAQGSDRELVLCFESDSAVNTLHGLGQGVEP